MKISNILNKLVSLAILGLIVYGWYNFPESKYYLGGIDIYATMNIFFALIVLVMSLFLFYVGVVMFPKLDNITKRSKELGVDQDVLMEELNIAGMPLDFFMEVPTRFVKLGMNLIFGIVWSTALFCFAGFEMGHRLLMCSAVFSTLCSMVSLISVNFLMKAVKGSFLYSFINNNKPNVKEEVSSGVEDTKEQVTLNKEELNKVIKDLRNKYGES